MTVRKWPDVVSWCKANKPTARGMCLNTSMRAYNADPAGASSASAMVAKTKDLQTSRSTTPPNGAHVLYTGGADGHGHSVIADGKGNVWTVDWYSGLNLTLVSQSAMESKWGNLRWAGWSVYYGSQRLDTPGYPASSGGSGNRPVAPDSGTTPTPPKDDDMPDFANAAGADLTVKGDPTSITWSQSWGKDYRTDDKKGLHGFSIGMLAVHFNFTPSDNGPTTLLVREATYSDGTWWYGKWYEFTRTSSGTGQGVTFGAKRSGSWKVQAQANGPGSVKLTDITLRGPVW